MNTINYEIENSKQLVKTDIVKSETRIYNDYTVCIPSIDYDHIRILYDVFTVLLNKNNKRYIYLCINDIRVIESEYTDIATLLIELKKNIKKEYWNRYIDNINKCYKDSLFHAITENLTKNNQLLNI